MYHSTCALGKVVREYLVANNGSVKVTSETNGNEGTASDGSMNETAVTNNDGDTGSLREDPVTNDAGDIGSKASSKLSLF